MVTQEEKRKRKAAAKKKAEAERQAAAKKNQPKMTEVDEVDEEYEDEDEYEEDEDDPDTYVSPLAEKFSNVQNLGKGVLLVHDLPNDRVLLDVNYGTRRGVSSTTKTVNIANATFPIEDGMKLSLNVYDKNFTDEELVEKEKILIRKTKETELKLKAQKLAKQQALLDD